MDHPYVKSTLNLLTRETAELENPSISSLLYRRPPSGTPSLDASPMDSGDDQSVDEPLQEELEERVSSVSEAPGTVEVAGGESLLFALQMA